jgi:hypothetical protein
MKKNAKKAQPLKTQHVKPRWKNVYDPEYREYFVTQAQLSKSLRKDRFVRLTLYEECVVPLQGKTKKPIVERNIKTTLVMPEKALERISKFLSRIVEEESKNKTEDAVESTGNEEVAKNPETETSYIR